MTANGLCRGLIHSLLACSAALSAAQTVTFDFATGNEGWVRADFAPASRTFTEIGPATWNPGGWIEADDFANYAFHLSPVLSGDFRDAEFVELDFASDYNVAPGLPFLVLGSASAAIYLPEPSPLTSSFTTYRYGFTPAEGWLYIDDFNQSTASQAQIDSVLSSLTRIGVTADLNDGPDATRIGRLTLAASEPVSLLALATGIAALGARRRAPGKTGDEREPGGKTGPWSEPPRELS